MQHVYAVCECKLIQLSAQNSFIQILTSPFGVGPIFSQTLVQTQALYHLISLTNSIPRVHVNESIKWIVEKSHCSLRVYFTFSTGVQQAGCEVLTLENLLYDIVGVHPCVVHSLQLRLHGVLFHWVSVERVQKSSCVHFDSAKQGCGQPGSQGFHLGS